MAERLLTRYHRSFLLCNACDYAYRVELDMPPQGSENIILRTGRLLSGAEEERIEQNIAQTDESLQKLGAKVKDLMALVAQLHDGERELMERRKVQQAYLAPVRRLPPEILSIIFKMYCGDRSVDLLQKRCPPLFLSSVCKVWRGKLNQPFPWRITLIVTRPTGETLLTASIRYYPRLALGMEPLRVFHIRNSFRVEIQAPSQSPTRIS